MQKEYVKYFEKTSYRLLLPYICHSHEKEFTKIEIDVNCGIHLILYV